MSDRFAEGGTQYVCLPCREMAPGVPGELEVPGDPKCHGRVWCPWCGDAMEEYREGVHG